MKPIDNTELESRILGSLSPFDSIWSNALYRKLNVNKARYTKVRDKMIEQELIKAEKKGGRLHLMRNDFHPSTFDRDDWNKYTMINCNTALEYLKTQRPIFTIRKNKNAKIKSKAKEGLDMLLHELDRFIIVHTRLVYAESLGLIQTSRAKLHQDRCISAFYKIMDNLLTDHKQFRNEIKEYAQSQLKTLQFKI